MEPEPHWLHVWEWFWTISSTRQRSDGFPQPLLPSEVETWIRLSGEIIRPDEVRLLLSMDREYLTALAEEYRAQDERRQEAK